MRNYLLLTLLIFSAPAMAQSSGGADAYQLWSNCLNMHLMSKMTDCTEQKSYAIGDDDFAACEAEEANLAASLAEEERAATMGAYHEELKMRVASSDCKVTPQAQAPEPAPATPPGQTAAQEGEAAPEPAIIPVPNSSGAISSAIGAAPSPSPEAIAPSAPAAP